MFSLIRAREHESSRFKPGDVIAWDLGGGVTHIDIVSDHLSPDDTPLVIHNIGHGVKEENSFSATE